MIRKIYSRRYLPYAVFGIVCTFIYHVIAGDAFNAGFVGSMAISLLIIPPLMYALDALIGRVGERLK